ncbi:TonB-dependent receptor [Pedobacter sp. JCM 36344]|uniref:TonB-dependent receptor n=1 Tax=Pedobacter sp. JCM 36344 TaxID=3374280 RepID=UPI00397DA32C
MITSLKKLIGCFLIVMAFLAFAPNVNDPLDKLVNAMHQWTDSLPQEKIYLHMDKPYYALGDTVWFKAYVTTGSRHQLSAISGALYIDLINEKDSIVSALKLPLSAGMSMGNFTLRDELKEGNYRIRAYTQWMRNAGADYFFDHTFTVISPFENAVIAKADYSYSAADGKQLLNKAALLQSDIQFFPESGNLVYGVASKLAFKAVGTDGNGISVKGEVLDEEQHHIADFTSGHAGMGNFSIRPEAGKTYTAKITFPDGSQKSVALPRPLINGYVLSVSQPNADSILVRIRVPEQMITGPSALTANCIVHSGGEIIAATPLKINKTTTSLWLEKKAFPSGIAQFTLFSAEGEPLNERIAFIKTKDQLLLTLKTPKQIYKSKEKVELQLEAKDSEDRPSTGNFSITVVDESKMPFDDAGASTIFSNLLLTSDIKGYVEKPNYYFTADNDEVNLALDNLMLTQGYRRFVWSDVKPGTAATPAFKAEGLRTYISGKVVTLGNKPAVNAAVTLMSVRANMVKGTTTDAEGRFKFDGMFLADSLKFSIQARSQKKSSNVEVILDTVPKINTLKNRNIAALNTDLYRSTKSYADNGRKQDEVLEKLGGLSRTKKLKEVNIVAKAYQKNLPKQRNFNLNGPGRYDQIIKNEEFQTCPNLMACLEGRITGVIFKGGLPRSTRASPTLDGGDGLTGVMLVVLDGRALSPARDADAIDAIFNKNDPPPDQIANVEILRSVNYTNIYGPDALNGVILITTKNGGSHTAAYNPSIVNISPKSFDKAKEFYSPQYDRPGSKDDFPDLRSTIYWNPGVKTDISGKTTFSFFNADGPGTYKVTIEGIDAEGRLGRKVYIFSVEAKN